MNLYQFFINKKLKIFYTLCYSDQQRYMLQVSAIVLKNLGISNITHYSIHRNRLSNENNLCLGGDNSSLNTSQVYSPLYYSSVSGTMKLQRCAKGISLAFINKISICKNSKAGWNFRQFTKTEAYNPDTNLQEELIDLQNDTDETFLSTNYEITSIVLLGKKNTIYYVRISDTDIYYQCVYSLLLYQSENIRMRALSVLQSFILC